MFSRSRSFIPALIHTHAATWGGQRRSSPFSLPGGLTEEKLVLQSVRAAPLLHAVAGHGAWPNRLPKRMIGALATSSPPRPLIRQGTRPPQCPLLRPSPRRACAHSHPSLPGFIKQLPRRVQAVRRLLGEVFFYRGRKRSSVTPSFRLYWGFRSTFE